MKTRKEMKKLLGNKYSYCRFISDKEKEQIKNIVGKHNGEYLISKLVAGYIKIECTMMCGKEEKYYLLICLPTGPNVFCDYVSKADYIGTAFIAGGMFVWHYFLVELPAD